MHILAACESENKALSLKFGIASIKCQAEEMSGAWSQYKSQIQNLALFIIFIHRFAGLFMCVCRWNWVVWAANRHWWTGKVSDMLDTERVSISHGAVKQIPLKYLSNIYCRQSICWVAHALKTQTMWNKSNFQRMWKKRGNDASQWVALLAWLKILSGTVRILNRICLT